MWSLVHWLPTSSFPVVRERTFFIERGGGGVWWAGALDGRVGGGGGRGYKLGRVKPVYSQTGEGHSFFGKEKITPFRFYFVYTSKATSQD